MCQNWRRINLSLRIFIYSINAIFSYLRIQCFISICRKFIFTRINLINIWRKSISSINFLGRCFNLLCGSIFRSIIFRIRSCLRNNHWKSTFILSFLTIYFFCKRNYFIFIHLISTLKRKNWIAIFLIIYFTISAFTC